MVIIILISIRMNPFIKRQYDRLKNKNGLIVKVDGKEITVVSGLKSIKTSDDRALYAFLSNNNL